MSVEPLWERMGQRTNCAEAATGRPVSQTKGVEIFERFVWVWDNAHDVVVARMVEAAEGVASIDAEWIDDWRRWASIPDLSFELSVCSDAERVAMCIVLSRARTAIEAHGDVVKKDLVGWSVLPGVDVSGGFLRVERLPLAALLDVVEGFEDLIAGRFMPDPDRGAWFLGAPGGRTTIGMIPRDGSDGTNKPGP